MKIYILGFSHSYNSKLTLEEKEITKETNQRYYIGRYSNITGITYVDKQNIDKERYLEYITFDKSKIKEQLNRISNSYIQNKKREIDFKNQQIDGTIIELKDLEYYIDNILEKTEE